jgi:hypothetical protein
MRRRDFTVGVLLASAAGVRAQERAKQYRIAIIAAGPVARIHDLTIPVFRAFFDELRRLGDVEGQNFIVDGYSGGGRPEGYAELAREVITRNPDVIVSSGNAITGAVREATGTIPIVSISGDPIRSGFATSLAHPGGNITGVTRRCGGRDLGEAPADPQRGRPISIQGRVLGIAHAVHARTVSSASRNQRTIGNLPGQYAGRGGDTVRMSARVYRFAAICVILFKTCGSAEGRP